MSENATYSDALIVEARRFEAQMDRVIEAGQVDTYLAANEVLLANELVPPVPKSRHKEYVEDRPNLLKKLYTERRWNPDSFPIAEHRKKIVEADRLHRVSWSSAIMNLSGAFADIVPHHTPEIMSDSEMIAEMAEELDKGLPISICGFMRQGKTSLAFGLAGSRNEEIIYVDAQLASLGADETPNERPMSWNIARKYSRSSDKELSDVAEQYVNPAKAPKAGFWAALDDYAEQRGEQLMVCFDELGVLIGEHPEHIGVVKAEIAEIVSLPNLDFVAIEHISNGLPTDEHIGIFPEGTERFTPSMSTPGQVFSHIRQLTAPGRMYFSPDATDAMHELSGGWLSLATAIGLYAIEHAQANSDRPRLFFDLPDVKAWEETISARYSKVAFSGHGQHRVAGTLFETVARLSETQQAALERITLESDGVDPASLPKAEVEFLVDYNLVKPGEINGKLNPTIGILKALLPRFVDQLSWEKQRGLRK